MFLFYDFKAVTIPPSPLEHFIYKHLLETRSFYSYIMMTKFESWNLSILCIRIRACCKRSDYHILFCMHIL